MTSFNSPSSSDDAVVPRPPRVVPVASLDWPSTDNDDNDDDDNGGSLQIQQILCAGDFYLDYELRRMELRDMRHGSSFLEDAMACDDDESSSDEETNKLQSSRDLCSLTTQELEELSYYQVLGDLPLHASPDRIKKAYRRACLQYHPDKTGRGEDDQVFLKVKAAFDTLSDATKRKAYDSTVDFDDRIPRGGESAGEFYDVYGPVFERNLRFDAQAMNLLASTKKPSSSSRRRKSSWTKQGPPSLGNDDTPMEQVHAFYEYWIHFESWRDFSLRAARETENDLETADNRYEKRWMAKEIDRKAKAMKREEMARINLLVERAMAADPRLKRERKREREEKERLARERQEKAQREQERQQQEAERLAKLEAEKEAAEKEAKARIKAEKEKEKKQLRKARQLLRKLSLTAYQEAGEKEVWNSLEDMHDDVEFLCMNLSLAQITELTDSLAALNATESPSVSVLSKVKSCADKTKAGRSAEELEADRLREEAREADAERNRQQKAERATDPWTKGELSALAKAIKKYPPGGANRWETIAQFINNTCKTPNPRTKEECIEKYNQISKTAAPSIVKQSSTISETADGTTAWTDEQDGQLQEGLAKFPATMDKNERWTLIAKGVNGRTKKECVQRFKAIREAIKNKQS